MTPLRLCLDCQARTTGTRCPPCQTRHQRERNQGAGYRRTWSWQKLSKAARKAQPWCSVCGAVEDLVVDHVQNRSLTRGVMVLCRACNSRKGAR